MEKSTAKPRRIAAHYAYTPQGVLRNAIVSVDAQGKITDISTSKQIDSLAELEHYSGMLVPGFVNAHSHLELSYLDGAIEQGGGFAAFASSMGAVRGRFSDEQRLRAAAFHDARMWAEGVAIVGDICNGDTTFRLKSNSKIQYINFLEVFGLKIDPELVFADGGTICELGRAAERLSLPYSITPHSTYSLNTSAFGRAVRGCDSGTTAPLSIHFMESEAEAELYNGQGDLWNWYESCGFEIDFSRTGSPAQRIVETIEAQRKIMLIHNTYIREQDLSLLQRHFGANLTLVLCPRSNHYISRSSPPVDMLRRSGVRIAVGTDSLASNCSLSMIDELKMFAGIQLTTLLDWATISGAEALGMQVEYGSIEVGKRPGLTLLTELDWKQMSLTPESKSRRIL